MLRFDRNSIKKRNVMDLTDLYNSLGIYELRCLAREKGIKRPTTKRKSELVRELNEISNDETLTLTPSSFKGGRPYKKVN